MELWLLRSLQFLRDHSCAESGHTETECAEGMRGYIRNMLFMNEIDLRGEEESKRDAEHDEAVATINRGFMLLQAQRERGAE